MEIYFIRHGQSTNNARWQDDGYIDFERESDPCLTEIGELQARFAGDYLAQPLNIPEGVTSNQQNRYGFGLTHLYCSLMVRAVHTGSIIADKVQLPLVALPQVHEAGGVYLETLVDGETQISQEYGGTLDFFKQVFPKLQFNAPIEERGWWRGGREEDHSPLKRAHAVIDFLKERHFESDDRVGIVTHGGFYNYMVRAIFGIAPEEPDNRKLPYWFSFCNCAVSRFDFTTKRVTLSYHNRIDFLPAELVTY